MPGGAGETGPQPTDDVDSGIGRAPVKRFAELTEIPQTPHVEGDVDDSAVNEDVSEQTPPFSGKCERAYVGTPFNKLRIRECHDSGLRHVGIYQQIGRHAEEYEDVDTEDDLGEADGGFTAADPRGGHDTLWSVVGEFAALRRFVLHAPLADFLAEGKAGKLAATSNAVCHGLLREYQQIGGVGEALVRMGVEDCAVGSPELVCCRQLPCFARLGSRGRLSPHGSSPTRSSHA